MLRDFHFYHFVSSVFSLIMYLLLSSVNTIATSWGMSFFLIGTMNFIGALAYILTSFFLGKYGDTKGHKKLLSISILLFSFFNFFFLAIKTVYILFLFVVGVNVFFGFFFPQLEGLLSKQEKRVGANPVDTVIRFNLSWSSGNILGVIFGPLMVVNVRWAVFAFSFCTSLFVYMLIRSDLKKRSENVNFTSSDAVEEDVNVDFPHISSYRFVYRMTLVFSGLVYAAFLSLFPKLAPLNGILLSNSGLLAAGANMGVFLSFLTLSKIRSWVGNPKNAFLFMVEFPLLVFLLYMPNGAVNFFLIALTSGITYAVPYTYAIFYALNSPDEDHSKQGGFHEATIGTLFALGPLIGGASVQFVHGKIGLAYMATILLALVGAIQIPFILTSKKWRFS